MRITSINTSCDLMTPAASRLYTMAQYMSSMLWLQAPHKSNFSDQKTTLLTHVRSWLCATAFENNYMATGAARSELNIAEVARFDTSWPVATNAVLTFTAADLCNGSQSFIAPGLNKLHQTCVTVTGFSGRWTFLVGEKGLNF